MVEERILSAVERIDGAMSRIEDAARKVAEGGKVAEGESDRSVMPADDLLERHETMRARVKSAIAELDGLIANG